MEENFEIQQAGRQQVIFTFEAFLCASQPVPTVASALHYFFY
jgi:hypothetical protein